MTESENLCISLLRQAEVDVSAGNEAHAIGLMDEVVRLLKSRNMELRSKQ